MTTKPPSDFLRKSLETATSLYESQMTTEAVQYLRGRGLSRETAQHFRLGVARDPLPEHAGMQGRLTIPYITASGVVSMRFRELPPKESNAKYLGWKGISATKLFNTLALYTTDPVFICEGEIDAMTAHQVGLQAVGVAGVSNWNNNWWRIFNNHTVFVLADNDDKGQGAAFAEEVSQCLRDVTTVLMPDGHDVNSLVQSEGAQALLNLIKERSRNDD